jgi:hypothetical protein
MTREARMMSGIILITVPTIQYGGYFLLTSLMTRGSGYMDNPLRQNFFRAGHAHAGVIVHSVPDLPSAGGCGRASQFIALGSPNRSSTGCDSHFVGLLFLDASANRHRSQRSSLPDLRRSSDSCPRGGHAWRGIVAIASG